MTSAGLAAAAAPATAAALNARGGTGQELSGQGIAGFNVRQFGAKGDGANIDSSAINRAIDAAAAAGGGTVIFPAGVYLSYSIRLKSKVGLYLDHGAQILAAPTSSTASGGYDLAEPQGAWEPYQDYGHNHWHNSLIWGEDLEGVSITGPGLIWGKGLNHGWENEADQAAATQSGAGN